MTQQVRWFDPRIVNSSGLYPFLSWHRGILYREYGEYHRETGLLHPAESETIKRLMQRRMKMRRRRPKPNLPKVVVQEVVVRMEDGSLVPYMQAVRSFTSGMIYRKFYRGKGEAYGGGV